MKRTLSLTAALTLAILTSGCLQRSLTIPRGELDRIARAPTAERPAIARRIRVVQDTTFARSVKSSDPCAGHDHAALELQIHGRHHHHHHHHPYPGRVHVHPGGLDRAGPSGPRSGAIPANGGGHVNPGGGGGSLDFDIKNGKVLIVAVIVAAAVGTFALIATEGMRYDGWVELGPHHPIHLFDGGKRRVVHLSELRPEHLGPYTRAAIRPDHGDGASYLGRAPLDRQGFVWRLEMGGTEVLTPDEIDPVNFASTMQLGYFPLQTLGFMATTTLGLGTYEDNDLIGARFGLEAQFLPLAVGRLHLGGFGMGGWTYGARDNGHLRAGESMRPTFGGGAMAEVDLTTRLALSMRAGAYWREYGDVGFDRPTLSASVGFAIY